MRDRPVVQSIVCIECLLAWLLFGDGAECLVGHGRVYWKEKAQ